MRLQIILPYHHSEEDLERAVHRQLGTAAPFRILKRSVDARQHRYIRVQYSLTTDMNDPADEILKGVASQRAALTEARARALRPVVVGSGPGGLFCAYWLLLHGVRPVLLEQGPPMRQRVRDMARFMKTGDLHPWSNICFGAGGAGTYSDGKLITRIRSPYISFIMDTFVRYGAPADIRFLYNPHLGSN
ncbi:MAG: FAD-dependent oxidoreductase, partial [Bacteroidetes bacterium]|nr:FAD-dependent oxidoreductase [Bacteroidota bacterium]